MNIEINGSYEYEEAMRREGRRKDKPFMPVQPVGDWMKEVDSDDSDRREGEG